MDKILVTRSSMPDYEEYINEIADIWDSHWLTNMGPKHNKLQSALSDYLGVTDIELFTNGHMALELTINAMGLTGEVITTPFTFASTTHAIVRNGLTPVFCDINPDDYTIDVTKIEALITDKTSAIIPVHVYGNVCNVEEIDKIAKKHNLKVIYDSAHAFAVRYKGRGICSYGDASMLSFHATKVFNTIEGGAICFSDKAIGERVNMLRNFGLCDKEDCALVGANAKMNEFACAMGICNLRHIDEEINKRKAICDQYNSLLSGIEGIKLNSTQRNVQPSYAYYPIVVDKDVFGASRDEVLDALEVEEIYARRYFYPLTSKLSCYAGMFDSDTPIAERVSENVLTLPLYADLTKEDVNRICQLIIGCKKR